MSDCWQRVDAKDFDAFEGGARYALEIGRASCRERV